jgi:hypothetical protein
MRWNDNHQSPIKYCSRDIIKSMRWFILQPAYGEHLMFAPQHWFNNDVPPKHLSTEMHTADWWLETQRKCDTGGLSCANQCLINAQSWRDTLSVDLYVRRITSLEFCWRQDTVAGIYDNCESIFEDPADALDAQHYNGGCHTNSNQEPQYSSVVAG